MSGITAVIIVTITTKLLPNGPRSRQMANGSAVGVEYWAPSSSAHKSNRLGTHKGAQLRQCPSMGGWRRRSNQNCITKTNVFIHFRPLRLVSFRLAWFGLVSFGFSAFGHNNGNTLASRKLHSQLRAATKRYILFTLIESAQLGNVAATLHPKRRINCLSSLMSHNKLQRFFTMRNPTCIYIYNLDWGSPSI